MSSMELILAAGCFWGVQATFDKIDGVQKTQVGYVGGTTKDPTYEDVLTDKTGHAEAIKITYDPHIVSTSELLDTFFIMHDPTTVNRQGPDVGSQYRSVIFYTTIEQKELAKEKIKEYQHYFDKPIVTEIVKAGHFYPAEEYHQKYFEKNGEACHICKNENMWKKKLTSEQYEIMRRKGTEEPNTGKYVHFDEKGAYRCAACGNKLFSSDDKFDSGCGWPSFDKALPGAINIRKDFSHFMIRNEAVCSRCGSHLGHVFGDGPTETGNRFCINSAALHFNQKRNG